MMDDACKEDRRLRGIQGLPARGPIAGASTSFDVFGTRKWLRRTTRRLDARDGA